MSGRNLSLLSLGLYLIPVGEGSLRACAAALGGDQFDGDDPEEMRSKISYFNWFAFCISLGGFVGLIFLVWVQDNRGWALSFIVAALMVLFGTAVVVVGLPFYRHQKPTGSPLTRILQVNIIEYVLLRWEKVQCEQFLVILQVFVAALRKRNLSLPENLVEAQDITSDGRVKSVEVLERTSGFR